MSFKLVLLSCCFCFVVGGGPTPNPVGSATTPSIYLPVHVFIYLFVYLSVCLSIYLSIYLSIRLSGFSGSMYPLLFSIYMLYLDPKHYVNPKP